MKFQLAPIHPIHLLLSQFNFFENSTIVFDYEKLWPFQENCTVLKLELKFLFSGFLISPLIPRVD